MQLKLYRAIDVAAAMAQARGDLGADALILDLRQVDGGFEVTAALDRAEPHFCETDPGRAALLAYHGVPPDLALELNEGPLEQALGRALDFDTPNLDHGAPPLLFAGPPGAGKTLTVARLATRLVVAGAAPLIITADGRRAGATEQLAAFTRLLGLTLIVADTPALMERALARREDGCPVLIDAPGTNPFDPAQRDEITGLAEAAGACIALVLAAGLDAGEAADLAGAYAIQGARLLVATRLDLARRLGGILAAAHMGGLALAEAGIGPGAADGLVTITPAMLAARMTEADANLGVELP